MLHGHAKQSYTCCIEKRVFWQLSKAKETKSKILAIIFDIQENQNGGCAVSYKSIAIDPFLGIVVVLLNCGFSNDQSTST